uniref:Uncharacterized protein n=1 Tax=Gadus morhua TaxID=8049 RepID=A0A8C5FIE4_GADMO
MLKERLELASTLFPRSAEAELEPEVTCRAYRPCTGLAWSRIHIYLQILTNIWKSLERTSCCLKNVL